MGWGITCIALLLLLLTLMCFAQLDELEKYNGVDCRGGLFFNLVPAKCEPIEQGTR